MMSYWFLALLLALVGNTWSMPLELDQATKDLAGAVINLTSFFHAFTMKNFTQLPALYSELNAALPTLKADQNKLNKLRVKNNLKPLKRLVDIQLNTVIFNILEVLNHNGVSLGGPLIIPQSGSGNHANKALYKSVLSSSVEVEKNRGTVAERYLYPSKISWSDNRKPHVFLGNKVLRKGDGDLLTLLDK